MYELYLKNIEQASDVKIKHYNDQQKIISELKNILRANDIVYIKGSRGMKMENIIKGIA